MASANEDLDTIIQRLTMLNTKFSECISDGKKFEKARNIFLEIKETHKSLRAYFCQDKDKEDGVFTIDGRLESPINYLIKKWGEEGLPDNMKDYVAAKVPILRYVYYERGSSL